MLPVINGEFRVVKDPEIRYAPSGVAVTRMRIVASSRKKNEQTGEWEDDKQAWLTAVSFKRVAENVAESFVKGDLVMVTGKLQTEEWQDSEGNNRLSVNVVVDNIGMSAAFNKVSSDKAERPSQGQQQQGGGQPQNQQQQDPWASNAPPQSDEPPF